MSDPAGGGEPPDKPERPDPFAPLPLADLPPVRRRNPMTGLESGPVPAPAARIEARPDARIEARTDAGAGAGAGDRTEAADPDRDRAPEPSPPDTGFVAGAAPYPPYPPYPPEIPAPDLMSLASQPEAPLLPASSTDDDLRAAIGATPKKAKKPNKQRAPTRDGDDDDDLASGGGRPRSRKGMMVAVISLVLGSGVAAVVLLGKTNSARYVIACEADRVVVQRGRAFPPWGTTALAGAEWLPLKIPPEAECHPRETDDRAELARWYLDTLVEQATTLLTAREVTKVDDAEAELKQALVVTRSLRTDDDRLNARKDIDRLLGDVAYWRASAKLRSASESLAEAAKEFDAAAAQRPRHVSDASAWATYVRTLVEQLRAGPAGVTPGTFPPLPPTERPTAPPGVALPVEPGAGSDGAAAGSASPAVAEPAADAGMPTGGVLL